MIEQDIKQSHVNVPLRRGDGTRDRDGEGDMYCEGGKGYGDQEWIEIGRR